MRKAEPPLVFPGGRAVSGWRPRLAPLRPCALWVGHLFFHHVEALVRARRDPDPIPALVLQALSADVFADVKDLESRLCLARPVVAGLLTHLGAEGLAEADATGRWRATGRAARSSYERRRFHFLDRADDGRPPYFVRLTSDPPPTPAPTGWIFDPSLLAACVARPAEWKRAFGFPEDIEAVLTSASVNSEASAGPWRRVVVDRAERTAAVLALTTDDAGGERLVAFAADTATWQLAAKPLFDLGPGWRELFPDLTDASSLAWHAAFSAYGQEHGLPAEALTEVEARRDGLVLRVDPPTAFAPRLREAVAADVALVAGDGAVRPTALLRLSAAGRP